MNGFEEIAHTADWALRLCAPDLPGLLVTAIAGMQSLMGVEMRQVEPVEQSFSVSGFDPESILVQALMEVLYLGENEKLGVDSAQAQMDGATLTANLKLRPIAHLNKEIKAVTYHHLCIQSTPRGLETTLVFDV